MPTDIHHTLGGFAAMQLPALDAAVNFATTHPGSLRGSFRCEHYRFLFAKRTPQALGRIRQQLVRTAANNGDLVLFNPDLSPFAHLRPMSVPACTQCRPVFCYDPTSVLK